MSAVTLKTDLDQVFSKASAKLKKSIGLAEAVLLEAAVPIVAVAESGKIEYANKQASAVFKLEDFQNQNIARFLKTQGDVISQLEDKLAHNQVIREQYELCRSDGSTFKADVVISMMDSPQRLYVIAVYLFAASERG